MITRIVRLSFQHPHIEEFMPIFSKHRKAIENFEGFISIQLLEEKDHKGVLFTISKWTSEDALQNYRNSAYFRKIWSTIKPWFSERAQAWSLEEI